MHALDFDGQVDTCSLIYLALQSLLSRTTGLVIMAEGRANEHEPSLNLLGLRQPKHPFLTSDLSHRGFNQSLDCKFDDGLKPIMLLKMMDSESLGLYDIMMDILNQRAN